MVGPLPHHCGIRLCQPVVLKSITITQIVAYVWLSYENLAQFALSISNFPLKVYCAVYARMLKAIN